MLKEEYNKNRPKVQCPNCGKLFTKPCYEKHYKACVNPQSKYNLRKDKMVYKLDHDDLFCKFCKKEFKSTNALTQHEIRCKDNPRRIDFENLAKYITNHRKGKNAQNCEDVSKQRATLLEKYNNGYVSPNKGKKICPVYLYKEHNDNEINKWLEYIKTLNINIPVYDRGKIHEGYISIKGSKYSYEHEVIASMTTGIVDISKHTVHHINHKRDDNDPYNLMVFDTNPNHKRFHNSKYAYLTYDEQTHLFSCELVKI